MHKTGEVVTVQFCVSDPATSGLVNADALPTGKLVLNGVDDAATVTVTNISTGLYRAAVTLPTVTDGDELQIRINATVATVAGAGIVWQGEGCTKRPADLVVPDPAGTGAAIVSALSGIPLDAAETQAAAAAAITAAGLAPPGGIYTQTVTVKTAGAVAIPNATVQLWSGDTLVSTKTTSVDGIASPQSNAGTFTLKVSCAGYNDYNAALTVAGNATLATITLSSLGSSIPAETDPAKTTAYWYVYGNDTELVGLDEISLTIEIAEEPADKGRAYDDTPRTRSSSALGVISASLFKGAKYKVILSDDREWVVDVPLTAGTTYRMPPIRVVSV